MDPDSENNAEKGTDPNNDDTSENEDLQLGFRNSFLTSVLAGNAENIRKCFEEEGVYYELPSRLLNIHDEFGRNALFAASMLGHCEAINELVTQGADVNEQTNRGYTPLHCAAAWGKLESLKTLVGLGANIQNINLRAEKARDIANRYSKTECTEFLDWAEGKLILELYINNMYETIADLEKTKGKLTKQNKTAFVNACRAKSEWLNSAQSGSIQEFEEQKKQLELTLEPIIIKLTTQCA
uniref:ankyrin repeat domain-containing protein 45 isoform X2 n=1 Tax=Pristiophorus japonicus TaxID=55135 RepID=UPI00398F37CE